jgi:hypothetical protein
VRTQARTTGRSPKAPWLSIEATVDVDIDPDELYDAGWHREEDCEEIRSKGKGGVVTVIPPPVTLAEAVGSLHRQAHPAAGDILLCHEEPCRSLTLDQMRSAS